MAVPKKKTTKGRRNNRRMHIHLKQTSLIACPKCGKPTLPHIICAECGYYNGKEAIDVLKKLTKKEKKNKKKKVATKEASDKKTKSLKMEELSKK